LLRSQSVVSAASQLQVVDGGWAAAGVWLAMVKLEATSFAATLAALVDVSTPLTVASCHFAANIGWHMARAGGPPRAASAARRRAGQRRRLVTGVGRVDVAPRRHQHVDPVQHLVRQGGQVAGTELAT